MFDVNQIISSSKYFGDYLELLQKNGCGESGKSSAIKLVSVLVGVANKQFHDYKPERLGEINKESFSFCQWLLGNYASQGLISNACIEAGHDYEMALNICKYLCPEFRDRINHYYTNHKAWEDEETKAKLKSKVSREGTLMRHERDLKEAVKKLEDVFQRFFAPNAIHLGVNGKPIPRHLWGAKTFVDYCEETEQRNGLRDKMIKKAYKVLSSRD